MLAVSATMSSGGAQQQPPADNGGDIDAAALDLLWGDGGVLPPLSDVAVAGPSNANGKRPLTALNHAGIDASALGLDGSIAEHLTYEYGTRTPGDTARPAPPPEEELDDDDVDEGDAALDARSNRSRKAPRAGARKASSGPSESAARAKANRERARRERLNDFVSADSGGEGRGVGRRREIALVSFRSFRQAAADGERALDARSSLFLFSLTTSPFFPIQNRRNSSPSSCG